MSPLPNALYLGTDKAGSSWLWATARAHPYIAVAPAKDTYFFSEEKVYQRGREWYAANFPASSCDVVLEVCHDYLHSAAAPDRILHTLGRHVRLLVTLRRPSSRAVSAYLHAAKHGQIRVDFEQALDKFPFLIENARYGSLLERYVQKFGRQALLVQDYGLLQRRPADFWHNIEGFLGVPAHPAAVQPTVRRAAMARSVAASYAVKQMAVAARRLGMQRLIGRVKSSDSINRMLYRHVDEHDKQRIADPALLAHIDDLLVNEIRLVDDLCGTDFCTQWRMGTEPVDRGEGGVRSG